jgi:hypothetical protein
MKYGLSELNNLYSSPIIIRQIKVRTMRWATRHVALAWERWKERENLKWRDNDKTVLQERPWGVAEWADLVRLRERTRCGFLRKR